jgi:hypothetical protein
MTLATPDDWKLLTALDPGRPDLAVLAGLTFITAQSSNTEAEQVFDSENGLRR